MEMLQGDLLFRDLRQGDEELVNEFFDAMGAETRALFNRQDCNRNGALRYCREQDRAHQYWVACLDEKIAGYVFFMEWNTGVPCLGIAVRDDIKGRGLGGKLMDFAIAEAKKAGKGGIRLTTQFANLRGQVLYESRGFRRMGQYINGIEIFYLLPFETE